MLSTMASRRPAMPGRSLSNLSNASEVSAVSSPGEFSGEDIIFSAKPSPVPQPSSPWAMPAKKAADQHFKPLESASQSSLASPSQPIAIELPVIRKPRPSNSSVYTPPAPLSARGDLPGGYFPLHEDQSRVYRSHPFHLDASKARERSLKNAVESCSPEIHPPPSAPVTTGRTPPPARLSMPTKMPSLGSQPPPMASGSSANNTPVASYIPSGVHANPLPMGKYYPSNYESKHPSPQMHPVRPSAATSTSTVKSDSQIPTVRTEGLSGHSRQESEAKRRLQQYQRDMIAQASLAINGGNLNAAALNAISMRNIGFSSVSSNPSKPNLAPLGSPGPVTPLDLETNDDGYLGVRFRNSDDQHAGCALRAEEERRQREGDRSPALSPVF
ncbi:hypothetical protein E8E14_013646 [Neopestalotiopsis sp. 37M]|nr:hypothetical protein E8E14_013646 [Neopestalotiopsis sp. 37M]